MGIFLDEFLLCCYLPLGNVNGGNVIVSVMALFDLLLSCGGDFSKVCMQGAVEELVSVESVMYSQIFQFS
jgi:hypothetical protein